MSSLRSVLSFACRPLTGMGSLLRLAVAGHAENCGHISATGLCVEDMRASSRTWVIGECLLEVYGHITTSLRRWIGRTVQLTSRHLPGKPSQSVTTARSPENHISWGAPPAVVK